MNNKPRLPIPVASNPDHPRESWESVANGRLAARAPDVVPGSSQLQSPSVHTTSLTQQSERQPSISSASSVSSSSRSTYTPSRSTSPTNVMHGRPSLCMRSQSQLPAFKPQKDHYHPYATPQSPQANQRPCPTCFERQIEPWMSAGQPCPQCGLSDATSSSNGKSIGRKVTNRHQYSKAAMKTMTGPKPLKKDKEAGNRFDQCKGLSRQQNQLLDINPRLPQTAAPGEGHESGGFTPLKRNNQCADMEERGNVKRLRYNKLDIIDTHILVLEEFHDGLLTTERELGTLVVENSSYLQRGCSPEECAAMFRRITLLIAYLRHTREHCGETSRPN